MPAPNAQANNVVYTQVQNPAQTAARAEAARLSNKKPGRPSKFDNPNRVRNTPYVPQEPRYLSNRTPQARIIVDEEDTSDEEDGNTGESADLQGGRGTPLSQSSSHHSQHHDASLASLESNPATQQPAHQRQQRPATGDGRGGRNATLSASPHLPFSSTEVFNGGCLERESSPSLFGDEEEMYEWAAGLNNSQRRGENALRQHSGASDNRSGASREGVG